MKTETIRGFRDYTGDEARKRAEIKNIITEIFEKYGFEPAETPIIESEEFVKGGNKNDEAVSDIYKLQDKGKRKLALRYEFTFQLRRLMNNKKLPWKRYQIGEVFRDEPVQGNRSRQFTTCEADIIGSTIKDEAEILAMISEILKRLGIEFTILINNRRLLDEILEDLKIKKNKEQILRELDKLDKLGDKEVRKNLKKYNAEKIFGVLKKPESYFKKYKAYKETENLKEYCKIYGVKVLFSPSLVRGLSYYTGTVFEIKTKKTSGNQRISTNSSRLDQIKESICGGGSYKFDNTQSTGFGVSLERLELLAKIKTNKDKYLVVSLGQDKETIKLAQKLRQQNKSVSVYYGRPSKSLQYANSYKINKVIFVGDKEVRSKKFKIKNLESGKEKSF